MAPIIWSKIANAAYEVDRGAGGFLGKPYEPNAVIKNDIEYILMQRKGGGYRKPDLSARILSLLSETSFKRFFRQIWTDIPGESTRSTAPPRRRWRLPPVAETASASRSTRCTTRTVWNACDVRAAGC